MNRVTGALSIGAVAFAAGIVPGGAAACSSTGCLMSANRTAGEILPARRWRVGLSYRYSDLSAKREGSVAADQVRRPYVSLADGIVYPGFHDDYRNREQFVQLDLAYGLGRNSTVYMSSTLVADRFTQGGDDVCFNPYGASGFGDLVLGLRHRGGPQRLPFVVGAGIKIPTGSSSVHERIGRAFLEPMVQPGSGSGTRSCLCRRRRPGICPCPCRIRQRAPTGSGIGSEAKPSWPRLPPGESRGC